MKRKGGRPTRIEKRKDHNGEVLTPTEFLIISTLNKAPHTFVGIMKETQLSSSTLSMHLKNLIRKGYVERSPSDWRIYQLTPRATSPEIRVVYPLAFCDPFHRLNIEEGKKFITPAVKKAVRRISRLRPNYYGFEISSECPHSSLLACGKEEWIPCQPFPIREDLQPDLKKIMSELKKEMEKTSLEISSITTYDLLAALAYFNKEFQIFWEVEKIVRPYYSKETVIPSSIFSSQIRSDTLEEVSEILKSKLYDRLFFPTWGIAERLGATEELKALLNWIRPLVERESIEEGKSSRPIFFFRSNLVGDILHKEGTRYLDGVLWYLWPRLIEKLPRKERKRGGEVKVVIPGAGP